MRPDVMDPVLHIRPGACARYRPTRPPPRAAGPAQKASEGPGAVGGTQAGGCVIAGASDAEGVVAAGGSARVGEPVVVTGGDIEQRARVRVQELLGRGGAITGQPVDPRDERGGRAGAGHGDPAAVELVVDGDVFSCGPFL